MFNFIHEWYYNDLKKIETSVNVLIRILRIYKNDRKKVDIISKYEKLNLRKKDGTVIGGYLSDYECAMGLFRKEKNILKQEEEITFKGEIVSSPEFLHFIKDCVEEKIGREIKVNSGRKYELGFFVKSS